MSGTIPVMVDKRRRLTQTQSDDEHLSFNFTVLLYLTNIKAGLAQTAYYRATLC